MDTSIQSPAVLSLCAGMLGIERGIERVLGPVRTISYVEIEAFIIENLVRQMEQGVLAPAPVWSDVKTFLPIAGKLRGKVDIITGGYPCQPFSHVGRQQGASDPRHLWPYIAEIIGAIRPVSCFFENVSNHLNLGYRQVRADLEQLGYEVKEGIYAAEEVGAPHIRKRLFILAVDNAVRGRYGRSKEEIFSRWISSQLPSEAVDNTFYPRLEGYPWNDGSAEGRKGSPRSVAEASFPLGQGHQQREWERPRVESRLGYTVNGYNYREDLLRMAGNAVVEQVAEFALRDLIRKHINDE